MRHPVNIFRLIYIEVTLVDYFLKSLYMAAALLLAVVVMRVFPALRQSAAKKQPLVPYFAVAFIPAYFL